MRPKKEDKKLCCIIVSDPNMHARGEQLLLVKEGLTMELNYYFQDRGTNDTNVRVVQQLPLVGTYVRDT